jgi:hypothetical protein
MELITRVIKPVECIVHYKNLTFKIMAFDEESLEKRYKELLIELEEKFHNITLIKATDWIKNEPMYDEIVINDFNVYI